MSSRRESITGLVLAGGRGSRMGGVDKGLQHFHGEPLAVHALRRLEPQVGRLMVSANRNLDVYRSFGATVLADTTPDFAGPLAGFLSGLHRCETPCLVTVPCDAPAFPLDLVERLARSLEGGTARVAVACVRDGSVLHRQPVFCLMNKSVLESLRVFVEAGGRRAGEWISRERAIDVTFEDAEAFANVNTAKALQRLHDVD